MTDGAGREASHGAAEIRMGDRVCRLLFERSSDGVVGLLPADAANDYQFFDANDSVCRMTGYSRLDLMGRTLSEVVDGESWDEVRQWLSDVRGEGRGAGVAKVTTSNGSSVSVEVFAEKCEGSQAIIALLRPSSRETRPTEHIDASDLTVFSRMAALFIELSPGSNIYAHIAEGLKLLTEARIVIVSSFDERTGYFCTEEVAGLTRHWERATEILGFAPKGFRSKFDESEREEMTSKSLQHIDGGLHRLTFGRVPKLVGAGFEQLFGLGEIYGTGFSVGRKIFGSAILWLNKGQELRNRALIDAFINLVAVALQKHIALTALQESQEQLLHSQKMEAVGRLAGGLAHDFNNHLMVILGSCELLLLEKAADDPDVPLLEQVVQATDVASTLTAQLLAFGRRELTKREVFDLARRVARLEKMLGTFLSEDMVLSVRTPDTSVPVDMDRVHLEQIIVNLVLNARDAMPDGGRLEIEIATLTPDDEASALAVPSVRLRVSDVGDGMDRSTQAKIFEPFFTTKAKGEGTGLGLATVYGLVERYEGKIEVTSAPGQGTTIDIHLPTTERADSGLDRGSSGRPPSGDETILVVEDMDELRRLLVAMLGQLGYKVLEAESGEAAIQVAEEAEGEIELLLTDVLLPGKSGWETAKAITSMRPQTRALFMSGHADDVVLKKRLADAQVSLLRKPFTPGELALAVRQALDAE